MRRSMLSLAFAALTTLSSMAHASLVGTTVVGVLDSGSDTTNLFDPANGGVPFNGFGNSASNFDSPTVPISDTGTEFGFASTGETIMTDFGIETVLVLGSPATASPGLMFSFTDPAFAGQPISESNNTFPGMTFSLIGDTIILKTSALAGPATYNAQFVLSSAATAPEPASVSIVLGAGLLLSGRKFGRPSALRAA